MAEQYVVVRITEIEYDFDGFPTRRIVIVSIVSFKDEADELTFKLNEEHDGSKYAFAKLEEDVDLFESFDLDRNLTFNDDPADFGLRSIDD